MKTVELKLWDGLACISHPSGYYVEFEYTNSNGVIRIPFDYLEKSCAPLSSFCENLISFKRLGNQYLFNPHPQPHPDFEDVRHFFMNMLGGLDVISTENMQKDSVEHMISSLVPKLITTGNDLFFKKNYFIMKNEIDDKFLADLLYRARNIDSSLSRTELRDILLYLSERMV